MRGKVRLGQGSSKLYSVGEWLGQVFLGAKEIVRTQDRPYERWNHLWRDAGACDKGQDPEKPLGDGDLTQK